MQERHISCQPPARRRKQSLAGIMCLPEGKHIPWPKDSEQRLLSPAWGWSSRTPPVKRRWTTWLPIALTKIPFCGAEEQNPPSSSFTSTHFASRYPCTLQVLHQPTCLTLSSSSSSYYSKCQSRAVLTPLNSHVLFISFCMIMSLLLLPRRSWEPLQMLTVSQDLHDLIVAMNAHQKPLPEQHQNLCSLLSLIEGILSYLPTQPIFISCSAILQFVHFTHHICVLHFSGCVQFCLGQPSKSTWKEDNNIVVREWAEDGQKLLP